jgi:hypothetical protein
MAAEVINLERSILITGDKTNFHANGKLSTGLDRSKSGIAG